MSLKTKALGLFQERGVRFGLRRKTWGLFSGMGTGKTWMALSWIDEAGLRPVAIVARSDDALLTWPVEIEKHTKMSYVVVTASKSKKKRIEALGKKARIYVMTYDAVKQLKKQLRRIPWGGVVLDEATEIGGHNSQKTRDVLSVFGSVPYRLAMSGTPIGNSAMDIFSIMKFIDAGTRFGRSFWEFKTKYFWCSPDGHQWFPFEDTYRRIRRKVYETCIRFRTEDHIELPPRRFVLRPCGLSPAQRRAYDEIRKEYELTLKSGEVLEFDYTVQMFSKMLQITGGFYYGPEGIEALPSEKLKTLRWMLSLPEFQKLPKLVIWANFTHEIRLIRRLVRDLGYESVSYWKHTTDPAKARLRFKNDPKCKVFIGQVSRGIGMNELIVADTAIYYSRSLRLIHQTQSEARIYRQGSAIHRRVRYIHLVAEGTVDEKIYKALRDARDVASLIVDGRRALEFIQRGCK